MKVACIQAAAKDVTEYKKAWNDALELLDKAAGKGSGLVVLPECIYPAYYLGYDMEKTWEAMGYLENVKTDIAQKAKEHGIYIAVGLAVEQDGKMVNGGLLFGPDGEQIVNAVKCNLWHFDHKWFDCGTSFEVVKTEIGKIGLIICADGRAPEIPRILALKGAEIIIDLANLTASGKDPSKLSNPQFDYMLPVRAYENGVWLIMADKAGIEAESIVYAGRSCIISPEGRVVAAAPPDKPEILYADIDIRSGSRKIPERRPEAYGILVQPTETLPVYRDMSEPVAVWDTEVLVSTVQFDYGDEAAFISKASKFVRTLENQDSRLIMLPQLKDGIDLESCMEKIRQGISNSSTVTVLTGYRKENGKEFKSTIVFSKERVYGRYDKIHAEKNEKIVSGSMDDSVIKTPLFKLGVMHDQEGLLPEFARSLMLGGADVILWSDNRYDEMNEKIVQSRAAENKVYLIRSGVAAQGDNSVIATPGGNIVASTFKGTDQGASSLIVTAFSRSKTVVPGTNVVLDRKPFLYEELVK